MLTAALVALSTLLAIGATLWYHARRSANAESSAAAEKRAREDADKRTAALENARLREEATTRVKDEDEGSTIVRDRDAAAAGDYLVRSFPGSATRRKP